MLKHWLTCQRRCALHKKPLDFQTGKLTDSHHLSAVYRLRGLQTPANRMGGGGATPSPQNKQTKLTEKAENEMGPEIQDDTGNHGTALFERVR